MPPLPYSRYTLCSAVQLDNGRLYMLDREPIRFQNRTDNIRVVVAAGDTWETLAEQYLDGPANPASLWWIIADFQPEPVIDPTVPPTPGSVVYIPDPRFVMSEYFSDKRRDEAEI